MVMVRVVARNFSKCLLKESFINFFMLLIFPNPIFNLDSIPMDRPGYINGYDDCCENFARIANIVDANNNKNPED